MNINVDVEEQMYIVTISLRETLRNYYHKFVINKDIFTYCGRKHVVTLNRERERV